MGAEPIETPQFVTAQNFSVFDIASFVRPTQHFQIDLFLRTQIQPCAYSLFP
jgi:hypothetical protein